MAESPKTITLNIEYKKPEPEQTFERGDKVSFRDEGDTGTSIGEVVACHAENTYTVAVQTSFGTLRRYLPGGTLKPLDIAQDDADEPDALPTDFVEIQNLVINAAQEMRENGDGAAVLERTANAAYNIGFVSGRQPLDGGLPDMETASPAENRFEALGFGGPRTIRTEPGEYEFVQAPAHYNDHPSGVECQEIIRECKDPMVAFAMKHLWRSQWGAKPGQSSDQDISKAIEYLQLEQARREGKKRL